MVYNLGVPLYPQSHKIEYVDATRPLLSSDGLCVSSCNFQSYGEGCGSPVVKVSNHGRHVMSSIQVPLKTRRVGQRCTLNLSRLKRPPVGVVW
ncbi:hypothetical protein TNCV_2994961 [Trichonephila clavipes]|nr:hypothetical protein TNCV_2994961 [Trichonephila clavipes]